jgi:hypothetical protein
MRIVEADASLACPCILGQFVPFRAHLFHPAKVSVAKLVEDFDDHGMR